MLGGQTLPVAMSELSFRGGVESTIIKEAPCVAAGAILIREVGGEEQTIRTYDVCGAFEVMGKKHAARGDIEVLAQVRRNRMG
jgi:hypothetical protein